jgi:hypothetical protein
MIDLHAPTPLKRFAVPHQFQPQMTVLGALVAVVGALIQIFFGSLLGAVWGVWIWLAAVSNHSIFWKIPSLTALAVGLCASLGLLIWSVQRVISRLSKNPRTS